MKAISLWQPWASLMSTGAKTIETRSWPATHRGPMIICSAKRRVIGELDHYLTFWPIRGGLGPIVGQTMFSPAGDFNWSPVTIDDLPFGAAVAVADLMSVKSMQDVTLGEIEKEKDFGDYSLGRFAWFFENLRRFKDPIPVIGRQGIFNLDINLDEHELLPTKSWREYFGLLEVPL